MIFHSSFGEWLSDVKHCTQRFLVKAAEGHARWAVTLAGLGEAMDQNDLNDLTFHLGRIQLQPPLEAWHLPLWLLWAKTPLPDTTALQVMVSSLGAAAQHADGLDPHSQPGSPLPVVIVPVEAKCDVPPEGSQVKSDNVQAKGNKKNYAIHLK